MMKMCHWSALTALALFLAVSSAFAQEEKKPAMMDEKAMMEAWMKAATPSEAHKKLEPFIGTWDFKVRSWMAPDAPPMESTGTAENRWILGGRYVEQRVQGSMMDQPFSGIGYTGYDNISKQYVGTWMDNMGTGIMVSAGVADESGKIMKFTAMYNDAMTGQPMRMEEKIVVLDRDHHLFEMWAPGPDGKMFRNLEIHYTRKK